VVGDVDRRLGLAEQRLEPFLALDVGQPREVLAVELEKVERVERQLVAVLLAPVPALEHRLQRREVRVAVRVVGDDLAVDQARRQVERLQPLDQGGELVTPVEPLAGIDSDLAPRGGDHRAVAVEFDLVQPAVARRHRVDQRRELRRAELRRLALRLRLWVDRPAQRLVAPGRLGHHLGELVAAHALERVFALLVPGDLGHRPPGEHARQPVLDQPVAFRGIFVLQLAQQPVLALLARLPLEPDQQPLALHPLALEREVQVPLVDVLPALARHRRPRPPVPQHHRAAAVFARGDDPLELGIGHRVVLGAHREPLDLGIGRGSLGHRPRLQDAIGLEAEVPVQPRRVVLLHDEAVAAFAARALSGGLGGLPEVALAVVLGKKVAGAHSV
jgi:hypothetical protein